MAGCTFGCPFFAKGHVLKFDFEWLQRKDTVLGPGKISNGSEIRRLYAEIELAEHLKISFVCLALEGSPRAQIMGFFDQIFEGGGCSNLIFYGFNVKKWTL